MEQENEQFEELPQALIDELKATDRPVPMITARVDREILQLARAQFEQRRPPAWKSRPAWAAIAATVLIALFILDFRNPSPEQQSALYGDIDNSGRVDIADVLALARSREPDDLTQAEIDALAMHIVSLNPVGDAS